MPRTGFLSREPDFQKFLKNPQNMFSWCFLSVSRYFSIVRNLCWEPHFWAENRIFKNFSKSLKTCFVGVFWVFQCIFSCDQAALWMVFSVRLSVCPSVRLSHLFDYVPIIVSSWNFQELSHWTRVRSMQKVKVRGQRSRSQRSRPKFSFPDCNSSLNSHMMIKLYI